MTFAHNQTQKWSAKITDIVKQKYIGVSISYNRTLFFRSHHKIVSLEIHQKLMECNTENSQIRSQAVTYGICGGRNGIATGFPPNTSFSPVNIILPSLCPHSLLIYHLRHIV